MQFARTRSIHSLTILSTAVVLCSSLLTDCATAQTGTDKIDGGSNNKDRIRLVSSEDSLDPLGSCSRQCSLTEDLGPCQTKQTSATTLKSGEGEKTAQDSFDNAKQLYETATQIRMYNPQGVEHEEIFLEAAEKFRTALKASPDDELAQDALFFEGESFYFANDYVQSNRVFEGLISQHSGSRYLDRVEQRRYSIAAYYLDLEKNEASAPFNNPESPNATLVSDAQKILRRIRLDDPTGKLADDATFALASSHMSSERYKEAAETFSDMRKNYPESEFQFRAGMLELESLLKSYKWLDEDDTTLACAEKLQKLIQTQFPIKAAKHSEILAKQGALIERLRTAKYIRFNTSILASMKAE